MDYIFLKALLILLILYIILYLFFKKDENNENYSIFVNNTESNIVPPKYEDIDNS